MCINKDKEFLKNDRTFKFILKSAKHDYKTALKELNDYLRVLNLHKYIDLWTISINQHNANEWELTNG